MELVDIKKLRQRAEDLILDQVSKNLPGEKKMEAVVSELARWLDEHVKWGFLGPLAPLAEMVDGRIFQMVANIVADFAYDKLKALGRV